MKRTVIGVMGPGSTDDATTKKAYELGRLIAEKNWVLLTGGRNAGVMEAASRGASEAGGLVVGILPDSDDRSVSPFVDIVVKTAMGSARNNINVLTSDVVVSCGLGSGTASEVCLALKANKSVVMVAVDEHDFEFFARLSPELMHRATSPSAALEIVTGLLDRASRAHQN
ncbi:MAG: TIGR00725 family protein [Candidatus Obscuribacterales bacterium]|nr:TIGR00725 family protein [Candidatus Obscuribacterales bacterium]